MIEMVVWKMFMESLDNESTQHSFPPRNTTRDFHHHKTHHAKSSGVQ